MNEGSLAAASAAFERHAWRQAFDAYRDADAAAALEPHDLERMAQAAWWISHIDDCLDARERAYAAYLARGENAKAAYEAILLAKDNLARRRLSIGQSWLKRAERLLEAAEDSVAHAHLERMRSLAAAGARDYETAAAHAERAVVLGARFGDRDVQACALTNQGEALVMLGRVDEGMALVDEATLAAIGGELSPMATGIVYCNTISICSDLTDYQRAADWTEAAKRWCERQAISGFPGVCRVHRAEVVRLRGAWSEAEREARVAAEELRDHGTLNIAAMAFKELGEIRLRMGDLPSAEEAFHQAHELGGDPQPGLALARLANGDGGVAWTQIKRALAEPTAALPRAKLLPAAVEIALARGEPEEAESAASELAQIAEQYGTPMLRAFAQTASGAVLLARGDAGAAEARLRDGIRLWQEVEAPYEMARTRELLGHAYRAGGDESAAALELAAARATFERLGAAGDLRRVSTALGRPPEVPRRVTRTFMFTDIAGSTNLIETVGDDAWNDLRQWHDHALRAAFVAHHGEEVDQTGDGFFVAFPGASDAIECAVGIQRLLAEHRRTHGFAPRVRIGIHSDAATQSDSGYHGLGVHAAARLGALATGDEILATKETLATTDRSWPSAEPREVRLKGISTPVTVVSVGWR